MQSTKHPKANVIGRLLPMAVGQPTDGQPTHHYREQAPTPFGACVKGLHGARHLLVRAQLTSLNTRTACGSKKLGGAMPGMYWSETNMRQRSANADTTRDNWVLLAVA